MIEVGGEAGNGFSLDLYTFPERAGLLDIEEAQVPSSGVGGFHASK